MTLTLTYIHSHLYNINIHTYLHNHNLTLALSTTETLTLIVAPNSKSTIPKDYKTLLRLWWVKRPGDLDLWPLTLKVVSKSPVSWATSVPILVFLGLSVLDLGPMYMTDRPIMSEGHSYMSPPIRGGRIIIRPQGQSASVAEWLKYLPGRRQDRGSNPGWAIHLE